MEKAFVDMDFPFESPVDFINSTNTTVSLPDLTDPGTAEQIWQQGRKKTYKGGVMPKERITEKTINLSFELKNDFMNWIILYLQFMAFLDHSASKDRVFLPNVFAHIYDERDNVIVEMVYSQITFRKIDRLEFNRQQQGIMPRSFNVILAFNDFDINFNMDKTSNYTNKSMQY